MFYCSREKSEILTIKTPVRHRVPLDAQSEQSKSGVVTGAILIHA